MWTSCPTGELLVQVIDPSRVARYSFGTRTAVFHVCAVCGAVPVVSSQIDGVTYAVVNVNTMEGVDPAMLQTAPVTFDDEDETARLTRRAKVWIPNVRIVQREAGRDFA